MTKTIYIIAGEPSGDVVGARLMRAVSKIDPSIKFVGIGGGRMVEAGLRLIFPLNDISAIGFVEVFLKLIPILRKLRFVIKTIKDSKPEALVTIDFSGFNDKVAKKAKRLGIPVIRYVAPPVWAWRPWRAKKMPDFIDCLFTLFRFEPPLFEKHGLKSFFVGHPVIEDEDLIEPTDNEVTDFFNKYRLKRTAPLICLLPGSRFSEIRQHTKIFLDTVELFRKDIPDLQAFIPTFRDYSKYINEIASGRNVVISTDHRDRGIAMYSAVCALAASGTVTLELAYAGTPTVVSYKVNPVTAFIVRKLINIPNVSLVNILLGKSVVPELLQEECTALKLYKQLFSVITDQKIRDLQSNAFKDIKKLIAPSDAIPPSEKAATYLIDYLNTKHRT